MAITKITDKSLADNAVTVDSLGDNLEFQGEYVKIPVVTTTQRDGLTPTEGYLAYNSTVHKMQQYTNNGWESIASPPILTSSSYPNSQTAISTAGGDVITLTGANFEVGANVKFGTTYATSVTRNSSTSLSVTTPALSAGDYDIIVENTTGLTATLTNGVSANDNPVFTTASGNIGSVYNDVAISTISIVATETDSGSITYDVTTGDLPTGLSISNGGDITGTATGYTAPTTVNFTVTATDDENQTVDRQFNIIVLLKFYLYELNQSLRFNDDDSPSLQTTLGTATDRKKWTWSAWVRRGAISNAYYLFHAYSGSNSNSGFFRIEFNSSDTIRVRGWDTTYLETTQLFRDTSAWYHITLTVDTTQAQTSSTASDSRIRLYVNGTQITDFSSSTMPSQNFETPINNSIEHNISGSGSYGTGARFDGYLAEVNFVDGQALDPTSFGEFKQDIWIPKEYTGTYGSNGFYLDFSDTGTPTYTYNQVSTLTDSSGNYSPTFYNVSISTNQAKYGSYSAYQSSTTGGTSPGGYVSVTQSSSVSPTGSNNITYEAWIYFLGDGGQLAYGYQSDWFSPGWFLNSDGTLNWGNQSNGGGSLYYFNANTTVPQNQWTHIAVTISGKTITHWVNGNNAGSYTYSSGTWSPAGSSPSTFGFFRGLQCYFTGFRVSNTIRYSSNFTPNSTGFTTDGNTMLLIQPGALAAGGGISSITNIDGSLGDDKSGNGNNWAPYPGLTESDKVIDVPTNKFATLNPLDKTTTDAIGGSAPTLSEGNMKIVPANASYGAARGTLAVSSGKWYFEAIVSSNTHPMVGIKDVSTTINSSWTDAHCYYGNNGKYYYPTSQSSAYGATYTNGDVIGVAFDLDAGTLTFYKNNVSQGIATSSLSGTFAPLLATAYGTLSMWANFGQDSSFAGNKTAQGNADGNGVGDFYYTPPSGYLALCTENLSETGFGDIFANKPSDHFNVVTYTGNGTTQSITGVGFQPDFVWFKKRSGAESHGLWDVVRGTNKLVSNDTAADVSDSSLASFDSDGFSISGSSGGATNDNAATYVAWCLKAGGTAVSNTDGSITSSVSSNTTAGFSVVGWQSDGTDGQSVGHGLTQRPDMIIVKNRSQALDWHIWHKDLPGTNSSGESFIYLNTDAAYSNYAYAYLSSNTSTISPQGNTKVRGASGDNMIAYCFHSVDGFSKLGSYTGNGSTDGTFVYTGFRPRWIMIKRTQYADHWFVWDTVRDTYNVMDTTVKANETGGDSSDPAYYIDSLSNGFKIRNTFSALNTSGEKYIYMAFAEDPFKYSNAR